MGRTTLHLIVELHPIVERGEFPMDVREFVDRLQEMGVDTKAHFDDPRRIRPVRLTRPSSEALTICMEFVPESLDEADRDHLLELLAKHLPARERASSR